MLGFAVTVFPHENLTGSFFFNTQLTMVSSIQLSSGWYRCAQPKTHNVLHPISQQLDAKIRYDIFFNMTG